MSAPPCCLPIGALVEGRSSLSLAVRRDRMRSTALFLLAMFVSTALVEFCVLRRWFGRRSLKVCVGSVSVINGVFWLGCAVALSWINVRWKSATEPSMTGSDILAVSFFLVLDALLLSVVALIPAGLVAVIYRSLRCQP